MSRTWLLGLAVFLFTMPLGALAQTPGAVNATGNWQVTNSGENFLTGTIKIQQVGSAIVGTYGHSGQFNGKFKPGTLQVDGDWRDSGGVGWLTLVFTEGGNGFSGDWGFGGRKPSGHLVATRIMAQFPPVTGRWDVRVTGGPAFLTRVFTLHQQGQTVVGNAGPGSQVGGTIAQNSNNFSGTWKNSRGHGWLKLEFAADSHSFQGSWGLSSDTDARGNIVGTINTKPQLWIRGLWFATYGGKAFANGDLTFKQEGQTAIGSYTGGHLQGTLPLGSDTLTATWHDARGSGPVVLHFAADGKSFQGTWMLHGKTVGRIIGKRAIASSPALRP